MSILLLLLLLSPEPTQRWDRVQGLPHSITALKQDKSGHFWVGTAVGLFLFDGKSFHRVPGKAGHMEIKDLVFFENKVIGGGPDGLVVYEDGQLLEHILYPVTSLEADKYSIFAGGPEGLSRLTPLEDRIDTSIISFESGAIAALYLDNKQNLWIGSEKGLFFLDISRDQPRQMGEKPVSQLHGSGKNMLRIKVETWVTWDMRIGKPINRDPLISRLTELGISTIHTLVEDRSGNLWIATNMGLYYWNMTAGTFEQILKESFTQLLVDARDDIWAGGSCLFHITNWDHLQSWEHQTEPGQIETFGNLVVKGIDQELLTYDPENGIEQRYPLPAKLRAIGTGASKELVVALSSGLYQQDAKTKGWSILNNDSRLQNLNACHALTANDYRLAGEKGAYTMRDGDIKTLLNPSDRPLQHITEWQNHVWFGGQAGFFKQDGDTLIPVPASTPFSSTYESHDTFVDDRGLWLATSSGLALLQSPESSLQLVIPHTTIYALAGLSEQLWLATQSGLILYDLKLQQALIFEQTASFLIADYKRGSLVFSKVGSIFFNHETGWGHFNPFLLHQKLSSPMTLLGITPKGTWPIPLQETTLTDDTWLLPVSPGSPLGAQNILHRYSDQASWRNAPINPRPGKNTLQLRDSLGKEYEILLQVSEPVLKSNGVFHFGILLISCLIVWFLTHYIHRRKEAHHQTVLDREKNQFVATASHELRTPLNGIMGMAQALLSRHSENLREFQRQRLEYMIACSARLTRLVDGMLALSEGRYRSLDLDKRALHPHHQTEIALDLVRPILFDSGKKLKITNQVDSDLPTILADEDRVQQILVNLLNNAIKYTETGTITVTAEIWQMKFIRFQVKDTGVGIPTNQLDRIFDTFTQVKGTTTRPFDGAGLGLTICKELVERQGGIIWAESGPNEGSKFFFTLPLGSKKGEKPSANPE